MYGRRGGELIFRPFVEVKCEEDSQDIKYEYVSKGFTFNYNEAL